MPAATAATAPPRRALAALRRADWRAPRPASIALVLATVAACLLIWVLRRPDQLLHPYVWVEEYLVVNRYQEHGPVSAALHPYVGYYLWPTSFSVSLATFLSFEHLPAVEYALATLWFLATVGLILLPPSTVELRWRAGLALLLVLTPTDPEVFGVLLYTFWWTSLWPLVTLLWAKDHWLLRGVVLVVGGMSSIAGALMAVPHVIAYVLGRRRRDLFGSFVLGACLVAQLLAYAGSPRSDARPELPDVALQVLRNASSYVLTWVPDVQTPFLAFAGAAILVAVLVMSRGGLGAPTGRRELTASLAALLLLHVAASVPEPLGTHPVLAGPRYYFLPFAATSWVLLLAARSSPTSWARPCAVALLGLAALTLSQGFTRHHDPVDWSAQLDRCRSEAAPFHVPVHIAGDEEQMWESRLVVSPAMCERLDG